MLNKQPLEVGQIYFSQPELLKTVLQLPNQPFTIDYAQPKILPFLSGWDNLLLPKDADQSVISSLIDQYVKKVRTTLGSALKPIDQFWIQFIRGLANRQQVFVLMRYLDQLPPRDARQLLNDVRKIAADNELIIIFTTEQESVFESFKKQVLTH
ncbi:hypothetical protein ACPBEH_00400 [Latilactobacillus sp. 5-91]|uniref:hypothetical protein n=1 Tax=Latilactobacillus sp. 5-91 TaxID=3410924 RepID=UPI003C7926F8